MQDYVANLPQLYATQLQWSPQFEQQNLQMAQQYGPQYKALQDALYPELSKLDTSLTNQAAAGISSDLPDYLKQQYQDQFRAEVGDQNGSGIGADYVSRNMLAAGEAYKQNNQNLALTLTGRQPLYQASSGTYQQAYNPSATYNYGQVANNNVQGYNAYSNAYSSMYNSNAGFQSNLNSLYQGYTKMGALGFGGSFA